MGSRIASSSVPQAITFLACAFLAGCGNAADDGPPPPAEVSFSQQVRAVREGRSHEIRLASTRLTDGDLAELVLLDGLKRLLLESSDITDAGLATLSQCLALETLRLSCPRVTDAGMLGLSASRSLRALILLDAPVTDAGILQFGRMSQLESIYLSRTQVTEAGIDALKSRLPTLHVHW